jgi:uncharacterized protein YbcV (DUF1398 family)
MNNINNNFKTNLIPAVTYDNYHSDKFKFYSDNKKKSGIYRWVNNINNKSYISFSISLSNKFRYYYSSKAMKNKLNNG